MNLFDIVTPANITAYWDNSQASQESYMGDFLFPVKKIAGIELNKIGGRAGLPVALKESMFDTQATYRDRQSIEVAKSKMPFFRERMKVDEELRQQILAISNDAILNTYVNRIFDDANNLIKGAKVSRERMAMQLISTGKVKLSGNGVKLEYDYHMNKKQKVSASTSWHNTATSTPIQDIIDWVDQFNKDFRVKLGYMVMTTATFNLIKASQSVAKQLYPTATSVAGLLVLPQQVKDLIKNATGLTILINDNAYAETVGGVAVPFFPDDVVTFLPVGGVLGNMVMGTTPEEVDLLTNPKFAPNTRIVDTGVAVYTRTIDHPVNVETVVSQIALPSFGADVNGGAGSILIANVA